MFERCLNRKRLYKRIRDSGDSSEFVETCLNKIQEIVDPTT